MRITNPEGRGNVLVVTATRREITTLVAGARLALGLLDADPHAPSEGRQALGDALRAYDAAVARRAPTPHGSAAPTRHEEGMSCT